MALITQSDSPLPVSPSRGVFAAATLAELKTFTVPLANQTVEVDGSVSRGDGLAGTYYWNAADSRADNGTTIIASNAGGVGRWNLVAATALDSTFTPAGAGAVARSVQAKERDVVALADFATSGNFDTAVAALGTTGKYSVGGTFKAAPGDTTNPGLGFNTVPGTGLSTGLHSTSLSILVDGLGEAGWINGGGQLIFVNGTAAIPTYSFKQDGGTGTYLEDQDVLGIAAGIIRVAKFRVQNLSDNTASGNLLALFAGGGSCYTSTMHYTQTAIAAVAKTIHIMNEFACWILVSGNDGTNFFIDELMGIFGTAPTVKNSFTQGAPAARTYTLSASSNVQLVMAVGTYATNTFSLQLKAR